MLNYGSWVAVAVSVAGVFGCLALAVCGVYPVFMTVLVAVNLVSGVLNALDAVDDLVAEDLN